MEKRKSIPSRIMYVVSAIILGTLGYIGANLIPFTKAGYDHWKIQEKQTAELKTIVSEWIKNDSLKTTVVNARLDQHESAISFNSSHISTLQMQTDNNTDAIFTILKSR